MSAAGDTGRAGAGARDAVTGGLIDPGLRYFLAVAQTGSITGAAERLHVAGSAISRQIARLEHEIGVALFDRRPRGMALSEAGTRLASYARRNALDVEQVINDIHGIRAERRSRVRVASSEGFAWDLLPEAIASFHRDQPETTFTLHVTSSTAASQSVRDGNADIAVTFSLAPAQGVRVEHSQREYLHAVVNSHHPLAQRSTVSLADLAPYALAIVDEGTTMRQLFDICCSAEQLTFDPVFETDYSGALYTFAQCADAVTLTGYLPVRRRLADDGLVAIPLSNRGLHRRQVQIQSMAGRTLPGHVQAFITHLVDRLQQP